jgi:hypothetical protein
MHSPRRRLLLFTTFLFFISGALARLQAEGSPSGGKPKTVRLLTVGNSFSHNAVHYLGDLAKTAGNELVLQELVIGGASFEVHWTKWEKALKDPADPAGQYKGKRNLKQWVEAEPWDFVTIQQASIKSHDLSTYQPFAGKLHALIKQHAPSAEILLHETWEYRSDDPRFSAKAPLPGAPKTQNEMYEGLRRAYTTTGEALKVRLLPVGDAFHLADTDPEWGFKAGGSFDPKSAKEPELPNQIHSLHVGWQWKKQKDGSTKLQMDGHHANMAGEYLGACVWYEVLFNDSVVGNTFVPKGLNREYAKFLQGTAHRAVADSPSRTAARAE